MFEEMTYENIIEDMLDRVSSDVDKREGSIIYDALAPCAYQLAQTYFLLNNYIDLFFVDTSTGEYLSRKAADYGLTRKPAAYSIRKIETTGTVDIGTRWGINDTSYTIIALISENVYSATCDQSGEIGNTYSGNLENIDNVNGVTAILTDVIENGEDEESDDNLRARVYMQIKTPPSSGNANHYKRWALEVTGIGDAKIFPLWNGPGTVKVVVVDSDKLPVTSDLISDTLKHIEEIRPIGASVTVVSGSAKNIDIKAKLTLASGYSLQMVTDSFKNAITGYFKSISFTNSYISYAKIGTILLSTDGVLDYGELLINDVSTNIQLSDEEIPVTGTVDLEV